MADKKLGKTKFVRYGKGGYQGAQFGLTVTLSVGDGEVGDFRGGWASYPTHADYNREDWAKAHQDTALYIIDLVKDAKVEGVSDLVGVPVEVVFDGLRMTSWRVLTEVL